MLIWSLFFFITYILIFVYSASKSKETKKVSFYVLLFIVIYFAAFRDGLGMDYTAYKSYCERDVIRHANLWLIEPLAVALEEFCYNTHFSAVIFFLLTSLIIYTLCFFVYKQYENACIAFFVFLTYTNLYLASLNLVRQFVAASIILIGTYFFIIKKRSPLFFVLIFIGFLFHKSAALLLFIYFLKKENYNPLLWTVLLLGSWVINVQWFFNFPLIHDILAISNYSDYLDYDTTSYSKTSVSNIYMHLIVLFFLWNKKRVLVLEDCHSCILTLKLSIMSVICANLSAGTLPIAYRFTILFSIFMPILFSYLPRLMEKRFAKIIIYLPLILLLWTVLIGQRNNRVYCPEKILPLESIYDENYHPYDNPDVIVAV